MRTNRWLYLSTIVVALAIGCDAAPPDVHPVLGVRDPNAVSQLAQAVISNPPYQAYYKVTEYPAVMRFNTNTNQVCRVRDEEWTTLGGPNFTTITLADMDWLINSYPPTGRWCTYEEVGLTAQATNFSGTAYYKAYGSAAVWKRFTPRRTCWVSGNGSNQYGDLGSPAVTQMTQQQSIDFHVAFAPRDSVPSTYCTNSDLGL